MQPPSKGVQFVIVVFLGLLVTFMFLPLLCMEVQGQVKGYEDPPDTLPQVMHHPHYGGYPDENGEGNVDYAPNYSAEDFTHPRGILAEVQRVETDTLMAARYVAFQGRPMQADTAAASPGGGEADWLMVCYERGEMDWSLHHDNPQGGEVTTGAWVPVYISNHFTYPDEAWSQEGTPSATIRACGNMINPRDQ